MKQLEAWVLPIKKIIIFFNLGLFLEYKYYWLPGKNLKLCVEYLELLVQEKFLHWFLMD